MAQNPVDRRHSSGPAGTATVQAGPAASVLVRNERVVRRRAISLLAMNLVLPGSAQLVHGNRRVGRIALRVWGATAALTLLVGVIALINLAAAVTLVVNSITLTILRWYALGFGIGWALLLLDAFRLANPMAMRPKERTWFAVTAAVLAFVLGFSSWVISDKFAVMSRVAGNVFTGGGSSEQSHGRINVLLIGGDAGANREGLRADSITVASISAATGRTVLFSLPRNLENVPFPKSSPMHTLYPKGYWCEDHSCLLNAIYTLGEEHADLYPGVAYPGVQATKEAVSETLGLQINYFAMVDMLGFEKLVDAVGGITIDIRTAVPIGGGTSRISGYIGPGNDLHLDGYHALWYARSREGSSDYERMIRQKCVMNAMVKQLSPANVLIRFNEIAAAGEAIVVTDVPQTEVGTLIDLANKGRGLPLASVSFTPPLLDITHPDYKKIRVDVAAAIVSSQELDNPRATQSPTTRTSVAATTPATTKSATTKTTATSTPTASAQNQTSDLESICSVS